MPRKPRQLVAGGYYHVLARGDTRRWLFETDAARQRYLALVAEDSQRYRIAVFHYCLMSNHVPLLVSPQLEGAALTKVMHGCGRSIERNPVRAKLVATAEGYPWSSARADVAGQPDALPTPTPEYLALGETAAPRQTRSQEYLQTERPYEHLVDRDLEERVLIA